MGLINLKTNLKSLKYGNDRPGNGSSNQPYIVTPIPDGLTSNGSDFLLRQGALQSALVDTERLTKWFADPSTTNGLLFTTKQIALERSNPKIPGGLSRIYNPLSTLAQVGVLPLGIHLNKQGLDPTNLSYVQGGGDGYFKYTSDKDFLDNTNRLSLLYNSKIANNVSLESRTTQELEFNISPDPQFSISYGGGPDSVLGIGRTRIKLAGNGNNSSRDRTNTYTLSSETVTNNVYAYDFPALVLQDGENETVDGTSTRIFSLLKNRNSTLLTNNLIDFRSVINKKNDKAQLPSTPYETFNRERTYGASATTYRVNSFSEGNKVFFQDQINKLNALKNDDSKVSVFQNKDLISFYFEVLNPKTNTSDFLFFRAYITDLGDNYKADWQNYKYVGRAENFYKYSGFSRDVSLSFTVYAHSREEMEPIYDKLNYLAGVTAPTYSDKGFMMGNILKITVGNYFNSMPGVLNSINLKPSFEAGWDINRNKDGEILTPKDKEYVGQLPRLIDVSMAFTPIHTFTPKYQEYFINTPISQQQSPSTLA